MIMKKEKEKEHAWANKKAQIASLTECHVIMFLLPYHYFENRKELK